jgi:hypothetical protein
MYIDQKRKKKGVSKSIQARQCSYMNTIETKLLEDSQIEDNYKSREKNRKTNKEKQNENIYRCMHAV